MKTTLTIQHRGVTHHLKSFQNGVIEQTTNREQALKFADKQAATDFSKTDKSLLAWRATTHEN